MPKFILDISHEERIYLETALGEMGSRNSEHALAARSEASQKGWKTLSDKFFALASKVRQMYEYHEPEAAKLTKPNEHTTSTS